MKKALYYQMAYANKLLNILLLSGLLFCSVAGKAQSPLDQLFSIHFQNQPLSEALFQLSEEADVSIVFNSRIFEEEPVLNLQIENQSLRSILQLCLKDTQVDFKAEGRRILLLKRPPKKYTLSGYIQDQKTGEPLVAATIRELQQGRGAITNAYGFFSLQLPEGKYQMQISYLGYQTESPTIQLGSPQQITIELEPSLTLPAVIVTRQEGDDANRLQQLHHNGIEIVTADLYNNPTLAGEADVLRQLITESGVQSGVDGIGGLHVRGGETDQNLVLLDGVAVYNPSHTLGLFSIFNPHTVKNTRLFKDGFSANYSGRLSSVIDVRTREGSTRKFGVEGEVSTLASKLVVEGPIKKEQAGFLLSIRRTHIDPLVRSITRQWKEEEFLEGQSEYHFFDVNAKVHTRLTPKDRLYLSFYQGGDDYEDNSGFEEFYGEFSDTLVENDWHQIIDWGNRIASLRWNHLYDDRLFSNTTLTFSQFKYQSKNGDDYYEYVDGELDFQNNYFTSFESEIDDLGIRMDFEYYHSPKHKLLFGVGAERRTFEPGLIEVQDDWFEIGTGFDDVSAFADSLRIAPEVFNTLEYTAYFEDQIQFNKQLALNVGLSTVFFQTNGEHYLAPQPRLRLMWQPSKVWQAAFNFHRTTQFLHVLTSSGSGFPSDLWVPSTDSVGPQQAWMTGVSLLAQWPSGYALHLNAYYKQLNHLIRYAEDATLPSLFESSGAFWESEITFGKGRVYGLEVQLQKTAGATTGILSYALTRSDRQFDDINQGNRFPFRYTHRHSLFLQVQHRFSDHWRLSASWQYGSGLPITLVSSEFRFAPLDNLSPAPSESLTSTNGYRLPTFHRLDLSLQFQWASSQLQHFLILGAYNLYNRQNPFYVYQLSNPAFPEDNGLQQQNGLPLLPSLSYRVKW